MHFYWIYFYLLTCVDVFAQTNKAIEIVRRGPDDEQACSSRLMDTEAKLPNSAFSASSFRRNLADFRPHHARFGSLYGGLGPTSGRAWCPNSTVHTTLSEWIQVEFPHLFVFRTIFTAGRGDGNGAEFMPSFVMRYQRDDNGPWYEYNTHKGERVINANIDPRNTAWHMFDPTVIARRLRIYPYSVKPQSLVCLRFALAGCPFQDGVTEYLAPEGARGPLGGSRNPPIDFRDTLNDVNRVLEPRGDAGGLGKLVDNKAYLGDISQKIDNFIGSHYFVGWKGTQKSPIRLDFKFDKPRNFSRANIFAYNSSVLRAGLFNRIEIDFIRDKDLSSLELISLNFNMPQDVKFEELRDHMSWRTNTGSSNSLTLFHSTHWSAAQIISVPLQGNIAQEVVFQLFPSDDWLLISEVQFISESLVAVQPDGGISPEVESVWSQNEFESDWGSQSKPLDPVETTTKPRTTTTMHHVPPGATSLVATVTQRHGLAKDQLRASSRGTTYIIIIGVGLVLSIFCVILVFCLCVRMQHSRQRHRSLKKISSVPDQDGVASCCASCGGGGGGGGGVGHLASSTATNTLPTIPPPYIFSPEHSAGTGTMYNPAALQSPPPLQVLPSATLFHSPDNQSVGTAFHALPGGDFCNLSDCQYPAAVMQRFAQKQQFYPVELIYPGTGDGDATIDSGGSLYTTPPDICPQVQRILECNVAGHSAHASESLSSSSDNNDDYSDGNEAVKRRLAPAEHCGATTSAADVTTEVNRQTSLLTEGAIADEHCEIATSASLLLNPGVTSSASMRRRRRPMCRRQRAITTVGEPPVMRKQMRRTPSALPKSTQSRADSGVGSSRAETTPMAQPPMNVSANGGVGGAGMTHLLQTCEGQTFANLMCSEKCRVSEYASTSLYGSPTAPNLNGRSNIHQPLLMPVQVSLFPNAGPVFGDSQIGCGPVQNHTFLSQGIPHTLPQSVSNYHPEATIMPACWPINTFSPIIDPNSTTAVGSVPTWSPTGFNPSLGPPLPSVAPPVPLSPRPYKPPSHHPHQNHYPHTTTEDTGSGRLSIYSSCR